MAKFKSKSDLKKSLIDNISLLQKGDDFIWVEFHEIKSLLNQGYEFFNEDKKKLYEKIT